MPAQDRVHAGQIGRSEADALLTAAGPSNRPFGNRGGPDDRQRLEGLTMDWHGDRNPELDPADAAAWGGHGLSNRTTGNEAVRNGGILWTSSPMPNMTGAPELCAEHSPSPIAPFVFDTAAWMGVDPSAVALCAIVSCASS